MPAYVGTKDFDDQIGGPIDYQRDILEVVNGVHKATYHYKSRHAVQVVIAGTFERGEQIEGAETSGAATVSQIEVSANFAHDAIRAILGWGNAPRSSVVTALSSQARLGLSKVI